jgi:ParB-like chromosome segregation protein Spo0J
MNKLSPGSIEVLPISALKQSDAIQSRTKNCPQTIANYQNELIDGIANFPPIEVFKDGDTYRVVDGIHRLIAAVQAGKVEISCNVRVGTQNDAILYAAGANSAHGLKRTAHDIQNSIDMVRSLDDGIKRSERDIAKIVGVHHSLVNRYFKKLSHCDSSAQEKKSLKCALRPPRVENVKDSPPESDYSEADFERDEEKSAIELILERNKELEKKVALNFYEGSEEDKARAKTLIAESETKIREYETVIASKDRELVKIYNERNDAINRVKRLQSVLKRKDKELELCKRELSQKSIRIEDLEGSLEFYKVIDGSNQNAKTSDSPVT